MSSVQLGVELSTQDSSARVPANARVDANLSLENVRMDMPGIVSDEELAVKAFQGDRASFTTLYERYFPQVYDLALRLTRSPDRAADVAQDTFFKLLDMRATRTEFTSFRAWLYTVARHRAIDELRKTNRLDSFDEDEGEEGTEQYYQLVSREPGPDQMALTKDTAALVWEAAQSLRPEEYALLDMHLRKGLGIDELAQVLGTNKGNVYTMLSRLQDQLEGAITALVVSRRGSKDCRALAQLLQAKVDEPKVDEMSPRRRRQILRHIETCDICQKVRRRYVTAAELLAGIAPILPPASLQQDVLARLVAQLPTPAPAGAGGSAEGRVQLESGQQAYQGSSGSGGGGSVQAGLGAVHGSILEKLVAVSFVLSVGVVGILVMFVMLLNVGGLYSQSTLVIPTSPVFPSATPTGVALSVPSPAPVDSTQPTPSPTAPVIATQPAKPTALPTLVQSTATLIPIPQIQFWADSTSVNAGQCTGLHWRIQNAQAAYLDGEGVQGNGDRSVCPTNATAYTLQIQYAGGVMNRQVNVQVTHPTATPTRTPTRTPTPKDMVGPSISQIRESSNSMYYGPSGCTGNYFVDIDANVVDSAGVSEVTLYYRRQTTTAWLTKTMATKGGGWYTTRVPSSQVAGNGTPTQTLEYYVRARDTHGNTTQSRVGTVTMQYCFYVY